MMAQTIREKAKIRQNREEDRLTEDDIARKELGPRGEKGVPDTATHDGRQQAADPVAARSRTHNLTAGGGGYLGTTLRPDVLLPAAKEKPRRGGVVVWDERARGSLSSSRCSQFRSPLPGSRRRERFFGTGSLRRARRIRRAFPSSAEAAVTL
jgi:hypothetical protein